jgi:hypothetical protein
MTIPMIVFLLPAVFIVVGGPAVLPLIDVVDREGGDWGQLCVLFGTCLAKIST